MTAKYTVTIHDTIDEANANQWNNLVGQSDLGSLFHRHEWLRLLETTLESDPRHIVVEKGSNPVAIFPNFHQAIYVPGWDYFGTSVPVRELCSTAPGYGGPLITGDEDECLDRLFGALDDVSSTRTLYHRVRTNDLEYVRYGKEFAKRGYNALTVNCRFRMDLTRPWEAMREDMDSDHRRRLRKMENRDVDIRDEPLDPATIEETYEAYTRNIERSGGSPYPAGFFEELVDLLSDRVKIFTAIVDGRDVGRFLYLVDEEQSTVHYYFSAIGDEAHYEDNPSQLLHAHTIRWAQDNGYRYYDFGGTGADFRDGVFQHKSGYAGEAIPTIQWQKGLSRLGWPLFRTARSLYRKSAYS